ncbi:MAG: ABC transporter permease subunit [Chloroflexi bacterium]|jgi:ABC-2 type transport system permease protein|nr:ABC transporter permease subunit [Chloroflexota bacterium]
MFANLELQKAEEWDGLRGFSNLLRKETRSWWGTRHWWINALLWTVLLGGLTAIMLFAPNEEVLEASADEIAQAGGITGYTLWIGLNVFFQFGVSVVGVGTIILSQDLIIGERQDGVAAWLLSRPVTRSAYILAKLTAHAWPILILLVGLPGLVVYGLLSLRLGALFPLLPFLSGMGIMVAHTMFYFTLTLMLGTFFNSRGPILGIALGSVLGGGLLSGLIPALLYVTPWKLADVAWATATGQAVPTEMALPALVATVLWSIVFVCAALVKFERVEY